MSKYPKHSLKGHLKTVLILGMPGLLAYGLTHVLYYSLQT